MEPRFSKIHIGLFVLWLVRACLIIFLDPNIPSIDETDYYLPLANHLLTLGQYTLSHEAPYVAESLKMPGYPLFVAAILAVSGKSVLAVKVFQIIIDGLTLILTMKCGQLLIHKKAAALAGLLYIVTPYAAFYTFTLTRAIPFTLVFLCAFYLWLRGAKQSRVGLILSALFLQALAIYLREDGYYIFWFLSLATFGLWLKNRFPPLKVALLSPLILIVILSPWIARNYLTFGEFIPLGSWSFTRFVVLSNIQRPNEQTDPNKFPMLDPEDETVILQSEALLSPGGKSYGATYEENRQAYGNYNRLVKTYAKAYWLPYGLKTIPKSIVRYITSPRLDRLQDAPGLFPIRQGISEKPGLYMLGILSRLFHTSLYIVGFFGLVILAKRNWTLWILPWMVCFPVLATSLIGQSNPRYEIMILPFLAIGVSQSLQFFSKKTN